MYLQELINEVVFVFLKRGLGFWPIFTIFGKNIGRTLCSSAKNKKLKFCPSGFFSQFIKT